MGLDMYLTATRYISESDQEIVKSINEIFPELAANDLGNRVSTVTITAGYWRKANSIHGWFVDNIQNGNDNCTSHWVSRESLNDLRHLCQQVLDNRDLANTVLPPRSGFFFGTYAIDQHYFDDIKLTISIIDRCLALPKAWEFEYQSSW